METQDKQNNWMQVAEIELVYKTTVKASERPIISNSKAAYDLLLPHWNEGLIELQEQFKILLLNHANKVLGMVNISTGGMTATVADPRLILLAAIKSGACAIIMAHNHPSGNMKPSRADQEMTLKIKTAAEYHEIKVLDHLIVSPEGYYSFADEGLL